ncbi:MAG: NTP transferase domain-containing protein [Bacteroidales bacterium]|nr:NTP transferase domain-containing protein [Bacteroidales bacterium]
MKAILFSAGLGTRIQVLSNGLPKALVSINGTTLLERAIEYLNTYGIKTIIVNVHHESSQIKDFINNRQWPVEVIISDESDLLLDTGGGLKKVASELKDEAFFIAYNVDILTNLNLSKMIQYHKDKQPLATLAIRKRSTSRYFLFDENMNLKGWENKSSNKVIKHVETELNSYAFSGIHVISNEIFNLMPEAEIFSLTPLYLNLSKDHTINGYIHQEDYWFDVGKPESYHQADMFLKTLT